MEVVTLLKEKNSKKQYHYHFTISQFIIFLFKDKTFLIAAVVWKQVFLL